MKSQTRNHHKKCKNASTRKKRGGGLADILLGVSRIRGQKYEHWLEERLVLYFNDINFVNKLKQRFGYDKTSLYAFNYDSVKKSFCDRPPQDQQLVMGTKQICNVTKPKNPQ
jgi:hypothetical protein